MASRPPSPLTTEDRERIDEAIAQLTEVDQLIDLATRAGIDVEAARTRARTTREQLRKMRQVFFPNE